MIKYAIQGFGSDNEITTHLINYILLKKYSSTEPTWNTFGSWKSLVSLDLYFETSTTTIKPSLVTSSSTNKTLLNISKY